MSVVSNRLGPGEIVHVTDRLGQCRPALVTAVRDLADGTQAIDAQVFWGPDADWYVCILPREVDPNGAITWHWPEPR